MIDQARYSGDEIHILSLDASKAFPSVNRHQAYALLEQHGYPMQLAAVTEALYRDGWATMRYGGNIIGLHDWRGARRAEERHPSRLPVIGAMLQHIAHVALRATRAGLWNPVRHLLRGRCEHVSTQLQAMITFDILVFTSMVPSPSTGPMSQLRTRLSLREALSDLVSSSPFWVWFSVQLRRAGLRRRRSSVPTGRELPFLGPYL